MDFLAKNGYIAFGCDHMGHGKTARTKEELGYFAPKKGFDLLVTDLHPVSYTHLDVYKRQGSFSGCFGRMPPSFPSSWSIRGTSW